MHLVNGLGAPVDEVKCCGRFGPGGLGPAIADGAAGVDDLTAAALAAAADGDPARLQRFFNSSTYLLNRQPM